MQAMKITLVTVALGLLSLLPSVAVAEGSGWLREKVKSRWEKNQSAKPAPAASTDVSAKIVKPGSSTFTFEHNGLRRYYRIHVPRSYNPTSAAPILFVLHGGGGDMDFQVDNDHYRVVAKSETEGFVAVFPNGYSPFPSGKIATWNAGLCCAQARDENIDDVDFLRSVLSHVKKQINVDTDKVFAAGMSNGGMMSYRLACEMPETFKAIAAVAGTDTTASCTPDRPVSILHIHAKDDNSVLFGGGAGPGSFNKKFVTDYRSVEATIEKWRTLNACSKAPKRVLDIKGATCDLTSDCKAGTAVQLCTTTSGGHSWPGGTKPRRGGDTPSKALSATDVMWDFFLKSSSRSAAAPKL